MQQSIAHHKHSRRKYIKLISLRHIIVHKQKKERINKYSLTIGTYKQIRLF